LSPESVAILIRRLNSMCRGPGGGTDRRPAPCTLRAIEEQQQLKEEPAESVASGSCQKKIMF
jgi:hypothetical protein